MSGAKGGPKSTDTLGRGLGLLDRGMSGVLGLVKDEQDEEEERMERELQVSWLNLFLFGLAFQELIYFKIIF